MKYLSRDGAELVDLACSRRGFLQAGSLALAGVSQWPAPNLSRAAPKATADAAIQIVLSGGPSQLDTWDPKPAAPSTIRGPFRPIRTTVPGMQISELFPETARHANQIALVRSLSHDAPPVHEIGMEIIEAESSIIPYRQAASLPSDAIIPKPCFFDSAWKNNEAALDRYGRTEFGRNCWEAVRLVHTGARFVKIQMFPFPLYDTLTWDCHANEAGLPTTLNDYRSTVCPMFDRAFGALLDDLASSDLLQKTLVVCSGEFGRSPKLNPRGGRDHWTGVFSAIFAGGGVRGGQAIGSSDRDGAEPRDLPLAADQIPATILHTLGISRRVGRRQGSSPTGTALGGGPILQLF
jgi:Protein of unknown function (DUF1501)